MWFAYRLLWEQRRCWQFLPNHTGVGSTDAGHLAKRWLCNHIQRQTLICFVGVEDGIWTHTVSPPQVPETCASAISPPPHDDYIIKWYLSFVKKIFVQKLQIKYNNFYFFCSFSTKNYNFLINLTKKWIFLLKMP